MNTITYISITAILIAVLIWQSRKSGRDKERLKQEKKNAEGEKNEADAWRDRPSTDDELDDRLHKLAESADERET